MPGIIVTTGVRTGPTNAQTAATATMFVAGITTRGPDGTAHLVTSLSDFEDIYGGYTSRKSSLHRPAFLKKVAHEPTFQEQSKLQQQRHRQHS